jgi:hypothetical protein
MRLVETDVYSLAFARGDLGDVLVTLPGGNPLGELSESDLVVDRPHVPEDGAPPFVLQYLEDLVDLDWGRLRL